MWGLCSSNLQITGLGHRDWVTPSHQRARIGVWTLSLGSSAFRASISSREAGHNDKRNKVWTRSMHSSSPTSVPVLLCLDELHMLSIHSIFMYPFLLPGRGLACWLRKKASQPFLKKWEESRWPASISKLPQFPLPCHLLLLCLGCPGWRVRRAGKSNPGRIAGVML